MNPPVLCIIQARYESTRLPHKMLQELGGETLIARAVRIATEAFGEGHVVVACPAEDEDTALGTELRRIHAPVYWHVGLAWDVLSRFHACAFRWRWHPATVIVRYTPDDPFKSVSALRVCASGVRMPIETGGEAFTLSMLETAMRRTFAEDMTAREHLGNHAILFPFPAPPVPIPGVWTIDTQEDLDAARRQLAGEPSIDYPGGEDLAMSAQ